MRFFATLALVTLVGCSHPSAEGISCGASGTCPTGYVCAGDNHCYTIGQVPDFSAVSGVDMREDAGVDAAVCGGLGQACCTGATPCTAANACCGGGVCKTVYENVILADNPTAYWRFEEAAGNFLPTMSSNVGTTTGGVTHAVTGALSCGDKAVGLDGTSGIVNFGNVAAAEPGTGDFSIEFWANATANAPQGYMLSARPTHSGTCGADSFFEIGYLLNSGYFGLLSDPSYTNEQNLGWNSTSATGWHHYVFTRSGRTVQMYFDGVPGMTNMDATQQQGTATVNISSTAPLQIGWMTDCTYPGGPGGATITGTKYFDGSMDELALYGVALSASQVAKHYAAR
jgi:hypothetical protein